MAEVGGGEGGLKRLQRRLLRPPRLTATADLPLDAETIQTDNFDLGYRLGPIYDILRHPRTQTPLAIAVYGDWGSGKTSAMKWLEARLRDWNDHIAGDGASEVDTVKLVPVWFYPWKYQEREDVWRGLIAEIILATLGRNKAVKEARKQARNLIFLGHGLKRLLSGVKLKVGPATLDLQKVFKDDGPDDNPESDFLNEFERALKTWLASNLGQDERIIVFIDDLDRCLPKVALQVLEALKLYLNLPGLVFVAGVDRTVINQLVRQHYHDLGLDEDKRGDYLGKMFQVEVTVGPSETEAGTFLDGVLDGNETWAALEDWQQEIFRGVILNLVRRSPREIKRVVNSALMAGEGIEMSSRTWTEDNEPTLAQGIQVELIRRILRDRFRHEPLLGSKTSNSFFGLWSNIVCKNPNVEPVCTVSEEDLKNLEFVKEDVSPEELQKIRETLAASFAENFREEEKSTAKIIMPECWRGLLEQLQFRPYLELLADIDLGNLMYVPFSAEAAEVQREDISTDAPRIVDEAVARQLGKTSVDEITDKDRKGVTILEINSPEFDDARPLAAFINALSLTLTGTQVSNLGPLTQLVNLRAVFLAGTQVKDLGPLVVLSKLETLDLAMTEVSDLRPLSTLMNLAYLDLTGTQVSDLGPLTKLAKLETLELTGTQVGEDQIAALQAALPDLEIIR